MNREVLPRGVMVADGGHIVRAGRLGEVLPSFVELDSTMLCGRTARARRTIAATGLQRLEWCRRCLDAYRAEGHACAEPGRLVSAW